MFVRSGPKAFEENLKRLAATDAEVSANPEKIHTFTPERRGWIEQAVSDGTAGKELQEALTDPNSELIGMPSKVPGDNGVENESVGEKEDATLDRRSSHFS